MQSSTPLSYPWRRKLSHHTRLHLPLDLIGAAVGRWHTALEGIQFSAVPYELTLTIFIIILIRHACRREMDKAFGDDGEMGIVEKGCWT